MSTTSLQTQQKPGFRKIMTWSSRKLKNHPNLSYNNASDDPQNFQAPASPTPSLKSLKSGRPSLFATFARRNSTKSEHSSRSRSPTSPRPSNDFNFASDGIRTPSPTPSRDSMIFERDIEPRDNLTVPEAIDRAIPPVLDDAAEAFVNEEITTDLVESLTENGESEIPRINQLTEVEGRKRLSLINMVDIVNNQTSTPVPSDQKSTTAETQHVTTPKEMNGLTEVSEDQQK